MKNNWYANKKAFVTLLIKAPPDTGIVTALSAHAAENRGFGSAYMLISEFAEGMTSALALQLKLQISSAAEA